jgi:HNH endonuclease
MSTLTLPASREKLVQRLKFLHDQRKHLPSPSRRLRLKPTERAVVLEKTAGRCHLCGGQITDRKFAADHVLAHAAGGAHDIDNYLPAHGLCNGCRWFYSAEEFQWILKIGVWARKQMEDETHIGRNMAEQFLKHQIKNIDRRKARAAKAGRPSL